MYPTHQRACMVTYMDLDAPDDASPWVCGHCRPSRIEQGHRLIQIRRVTRELAVNVSDIFERLDVSGIQSYWSNGERILFLRQRDTRSKDYKYHKGPTTCVRDSRPLMDASAHYCSIQCKQQHEQQQPKKADGRVKRQRIASDVGSEAIFKRKIIRPIIRPIIRRRKSYSPPQRAMME